VVALLADRLGQTSAYHAALAKLASFVEAGQLPASEVPEVFDYHTHRGDVEAMNRTLKSLPEDARPPTRTLWTARILRAKQKYGEALKALAGIPEGFVTPDVLALQARLQAESGAVDESILTWTRALGLGLETDPDAHAGLGTAYLRRGLFELAIESYVKAVSLDPEQPRHRSNLAVAYAALDRREDALKEVFAALSKAPSDPLLRHQLDRLSAKAAAPAPPAPSGPAIAVLPLTTSGGAVDRPGMGQMIAAMLVTTLVKRGGPPVVERARLDEVLREHEIQATGYVDPKTAVSMGKVLGARHLITGNVAEFADGLSVDLHLTDVETGKVVAAARGRSAVTAAAADEMLGRLAGEMLERR
jgi:tetratricopeptide (TPR) repeat protein